MDIDTAIESCVNCDTDWFVHVVGVTDQAKVSEWAAGWTCDDRCLRGTGQRLQLCPGPADGES